MATKWRKKCTRMLIGDVHLLLNSILYAPPILSIKLSLVQLLWWDNLIRLEICSGESSILRTFKHKSIHNYTYKMSHILLDFNCFLLNEKLNDQQIIYFSTQPFTVMLKPFYVVCLDLQPLVSGMPNEKCLVWIIVLEQKSSLMPHKSWLLCPCPFAHYVETITIIPNTCVYVHCTRVIISVICMNMRVKIIIIYMENCSTQTKKFTRLVSTHL